MVSTDKAVNGYTSSPGEVSREYDANGNLRKVTTTAGTREMGYDHGNRMVRFTDEDGNVARYDYDPFGRRVRKITHVNTQAEEETRFVLHGQRVIEERDENNTLGRSFAWGVYSELESLGCPVESARMNCSNEPRLHGIAGFILTEFPPSTRPNRIILCVNHSSFARPSAHSSQSRFLQTLRHEYLHALEMCRGDFDLQCEDHDEGDSCCRRRVCAEMRSYWFSGQCLPGGSHLETTPDADPDRRMESCLIRPAGSSSAPSCNADLDKARHLAAEMMAECISNFVQP